MHEQVICSEFNGKQDSFNYTELLFQIITTDN